MSGGLTSRGRNRVLSVLLALVLVTSVVAATPLAAGATSETEPNDDRTNAQSIQTETTITGEVQSSDDDDWFAFTVQRGETINVSGTVAKRSDGFDEDGNVVVELRDSNGNRIAKNRVGGGTESFTIGTTAVTGGTYYVRVEPEFGGFAADYDFIARTYSTDSFEPNEDRGNATDLSVGAEQRGDLSIGDEDWFAFTAQRGETINVSGTVTERSSGFDNGGNVVVELRDSNGNQIDQNRVGDGPESFTIGTTVVTGGTYYVRVEQEFGGFAADYNFTARTYSTDSFEPNENRSTAAPLFENSFTPAEAQLSIGDADFFEYGLEAGETVHVEARTSVESADQELEIFAPGDDDPVNDTVISGGSAGVVAWTAQSAGVHNVAIRPQFGGTSDYNVTITAGGETVGPPNDRFEAQAGAPRGNQDRANATPIDSGRYGNLGMVDDDRDVFSFRAAQDARVVANVSYDTSANDLSLELTDSSGATVASGGDGLAVNVSATGTYYLTVSGQTGAQSTYALELNVSGSGPGPLPGQSQAPIDTDGDGQYEDITGDGTFNVIDVSVFLAAFGSVGGDQVIFFDFSGDGQINILDVAALLDET